MIRTLAQRAISTGTASASNRNVPRCRALSHRSRQTMASSTTNIIVRSTDRRSVKAVRCHIMPKNTICGTILRSWLRRKRRFGGVNIRVCESFETSA